LSKDQATASEIVRRCKDTIAMVDRLVNSEANARRIALVEGCFGSAGQPLGVPGRVLVGEGVLTKACRKKVKPRQFFLFNDLLVYGNIIINKKKYNTQHIIPLEEVKLKSLEDDGQFKNGWLICTRGKSFAVYAATATEKQEWMAHINKCIEDLLKKSGKKASDSHAAVWVPDSEANTCMHCKKVQFTLVNRRHHCRKCGMVCCNLCSSKRFLLPAQGSKPLRVCLSCYDELAMQGAGGENSFNKGNKDGDSSGEDDSDEEENGGNIEVYHDFLTGGSIYNTSQLCSEQNHLQSRLIKLFEKGKKVSVATRKQDSETEEGFIVFEDNTTNKQFPVLSPIDANPPYLLPFGSPSLPSSRGAGRARHATDPKIRRHQLQHPLEGVHFRLSSRLSTEDKLQYMVTVMDSVLKKVNSIEWEAMEYNFVLEKTLMQANTKM